MTGGSFAELGVAPLLIDRLAERQIREPTDIQKRVIPPLLAGENVLFSSATGTGKTFAYLLPVLQRLFTPLSGDPAGGRREGPACLIAAPTYELCSQIKGELDFLLSSPRQSALLIGSANLGRQIGGLKKDKPALVVGNPGRLLQLTRMGKLSLRSIRFLVLDEGDRLVSEELFAETRELMALVNPDRQSLSCSATIPPPSRERLLPFLGANPRVETSDAAELLRGSIEHWAIFSEGRRKIGTLRSFLAAVAPRKALIFADRAGQAGNVLSQLQYHHVPAAGLYGDMEKQARKQALEDFRRGTTPLLVTSDLASRGLDINGVSHVIALDVPSRGDAYIHRAGRTARAGKKGIMVSIGDEEEMRRLAGLEKKLGIVIYPKELYRGKLYSTTDSPSGG
jgi:superfamily II DNA/RNA helicase